MNDDEEITALFERMCRAWTEGNARAYGACFTADCDYVSYDGYRERGREPTVASHDKLLRGSCTARRWSAASSRSATSATASQWCMAPGRCRWPGARGCPSGA